MRTFARIILGAVCFGFAGRGVSPDQHIAGTVRDTSGARSTRRHRRSRPAPC